MMKREEKQPNKIEDTKFSIKSGSCVSRYGEIKDGEMHLTSEVYGDDFDSEQHISFSKADTKRILSMMTLDEFCDFYGKVGTLGLNDFIREHKLKPKTITI